MCVAEEPDWPVTEPFRMLLATLTQYPAKLLVAQDCLGTKHLLGNLEEGVFPKKMQDFLCLLQTEHRTKKMHKQLGCLPRATVGRALFLFLSSCELLSLVVKQFLSKKFKAFSFVGDECSSPTFNEI